MRTLTIAAAIGGMVLLAAAPGFASQQGGPDVTNPVLHQGAMADWNSTVQQPYIAPGDQPTVLVHALTGGPLGDPAGEINYGRFTGISG